ncbi:TorS-related protein [Capsulimonas corticalis]|uniref:TorS-related protein n=1 Tax=Capsulimonas corticalis TaxID=2219043 RepID=A0A402D311_9BACT|nr:ATP-binding SpoIIE family protein phosphatase [Capsulimonas corticalis]BDI28388.1 TorS-related protein [Capsulimonas corticalis]
MNTSTALEITDATLVGEARRRVASLTHSLGFNEETRGRVALIVTELATNILKHAQTGEIVFRELREGDAAGIEILSLDRGPGISNVAQSLADGYSTAGTPGNGLGAVVRLSSTFDIYTQSGAGTAILSRIWDRPTSFVQPGAPLEIGVVCVPKPGETECGDAWSSSQSPQRCSLFVADGLGHGPVAAEASREAVRVFDAVAETSDSKRIIEAAHLALRSTRGSVVAVGQIAPEDGILRYVGVGNISSTLLTPEGTRSLVSHNGTVGQTMRTLNEFTYPWPRTALLVMASDGLQSQWTLDKYPGLASRHPSLIAGVLYRDFNRRRDDVTVLVARWKERATQ